MSASTKLSDVELVLLLKQGDRNAYSEIYSRFFGLLYAFVHRKLKDEGDAKDIVQEIFAGIWEKRESLTFSGSLPAYLYTAVRNKMLDLIGRKDVEGRYIRSLENFMDQDSVCSDYLIREKQLAVRIEQEIDALPKKMKTIFLLSRMEHLSHREIALKLDVSDLTVRSHIKHALRILRVRLGIVAYILLLIKFFN